MKVVCPNPQSSERGNGSAIVVVLVLLLVTLALLGTSSETLRSLRRELQLLEQRQTNALCGFRVVNPPITNNCGASRDKIESACDQ